MIKKVIRSLLLTGVVYGLVGFAYIAGNAWFHPQTLSMQLTHHFTFPREDDFAIISVSISIICFFIINLTKRR